MYDAAEKAELVLRGHCEFCLEPPGAVHGSYCINQYYILSEDKWYRPGVVPAYDGGTGERIYPVR